MYGGANVIAGLTNIGSSNAAFARQFLQTEGILLAHADVGGTSARKVEFMPYEGKARCSKVSEALPVARAPAPVLAGGDIELF